MYSRPLPMLGVHFTFYFYILLLIFFFFLGIVRKNIECLFPMANSNNVRYLTLIQKKKETIVKIET
jgi:hypothetical protein